MTTFSSVAAISPIWNVVLTGRGEAERLETTTYSPCRRWWSTAQRRFVMLLLTGFAIAALLLAGVGI